MYECPINYGTFREWIETNYNSEISEQMWTQLVEERDKLSFGCGCGSSEDLGHTQEDITVDELVNNVVNTASAGDDINDNE